MRSRSKTGVVGRHSVLSVDYFHTPLFIQQVRWYELTVREKTDGTGRVYSVSIDTETKQHSILERDCSFLFYFTSIQSRCNVLVRTLLSPTLPHFVTSPSYTTSVLLYLRRIYKLVMTFGGPSLTH